MKLATVLLLIPCLMRAEVAYLQLPDEQVDEAKLTALREDFDCVVGLNNDRFPTIEMAAAVALGRIMNKGHEVEYAGYILELNEQFIYSEPVTQGSPNRSKLGCILFLPGSKLAAVYHTHLADPRFSQADRRHSAGLGVVSFVGTLRDWFILSYDPDTGATANVGTIMAEGDQLRFARAED